MKPVFFLSAAVILVIGAGCAPKLAETPYTETEVQWKDYLKKSYPSWDPPQTLPPLDEGKAETLDDGPDAPPTVEVIAVEEIDTTAKTESTPEEKPANLELAEDSPLIINEEIQVPESAPASEGNFESYVVQKGDTLWTISQKFYQKGSLWRRIFEANQDKISDPNRVVEGLELKIPLEK